MKIIKIEWDSEKGIRRVNEFDPSTKMVPSDCDIMGWLEPHMITNRTRGYITDKKTYELIKKEHTVSEKGYKGREEELEL